MFWRWPRLQLYANVTQQSFLMYCFFCRLDITPQHTINNITTFVAGVSGNYPGEGIGVAGFLTSLTTEEDLPRTVPFERWNLEEYYMPETRGDLTMYTRIASFLSNMEHFDASLFRSASCLSMLYSSVSSKSSSILTMNCLHPNSCLNDFSVSLGI